MKKTSWIATAVGGGAVVALLAWAFAPRPVEVEAATTGRGRFEAFIEEDGRTRLRDRYVVSAPLAGQLARMSLREGDRVEAGAVLAVLAPALSPMLDRRSLREQELQVDIAQAQVRRAQARIEAARVAAYRSRNESIRSDKLGNQGYVSQDKLESDRLAALATQKELEAAVQEHRMAEHELAQARAALMTVRTPERSAVRGFELRAPVAGQVLRVAQTSETAVALGTPLVELGDTRDLEVVAELLTADALQARPGSAVHIERWGGAALEGRVRRVEPAAFTKVSALGVEEQRVKVLIDITSPPQQWQALGDGFRVGVRIVTLALDDAVTVPASAVFPLPAGSDGEGGGMAVFTVDGGRANLRPVQVGARNGTLAWVKQGLTDGVATIVYPPKAVAEGVRVKVRSVQQ